MQWGVEMAQLPTVDVKRASEESHKLLVQ